MPTYTITLTDAEDRALRVVALDPQAWIENCVKNRCRISMDDILQQEIRRRLDSGEPIPSNRDQLINEAPVKTAAEVQSEAISIGLEPTRPVEDA